jgi:hypothetical protein
MAEATIRSLTTPGGAVAGSKALAAPGGGREPTADELRQRVATRFRSLASSTSALRGEVRSRVQATTDVKRQALRHPLWVVGLVAGAGLLGAGMLRRRRGPIAARVAGLIAGVLVKRVAKRLESKLAYRVSERRSYGARRR